MTNKPTAKQLYIPIVLFFIFVNAFFIIGTTWLVKLGIDQGVALIGNLILFIATFLSLFLYQRALSHASTMGFLRNTYSGLIIKLFICLLGVLIYAMIAKSNINKPGIFACIFLYFVYTIIEMRSLMRRNKARTNA